MCVLIKYCIAPSYMFTACRDVSPYTLYLIRRKIIQLVMSKDVFGIGHQTMTINVHKYSQPLIE